MNDPFAPWFGMQSNKAIAQKILKRFVGLHTTTRRDPGHAAYQSA